MKKILSFVLCFFLLFSLSFSSFAIGFQTDSDLTASSSQVTALLSLRSHDEVLKDYVCIRTEKEYLLFVSDNFNVVDDIISATDVVCYAYNNSYPSSSTRYYSVHYDEVTISKSHLVVSNFIDFSSKPDNSDFNKRFTIVIICILAVLIFLVLRRFK